MTKLLVSTAGLTGVVAALFITSLVFSILTWTRVKNDNDNPPRPKEPLSRPVVQLSSSIQTTVSENVVTEPIVTVPTVSRTRVSAKTISPRSSATTSTRTLRTLTTPKFVATEAAPRRNRTIMCPNYGVSDNSYAYQEAASFILSGLDERVNPCEDFYAFTCNKFLKDHKAEEHGVSRYGAIKELQDAVNTEIVDALFDVDVNDKKRSETERITKALLHDCVYHISPNVPTETIINFLEEIARMFGGIPFLNHTLKEDFDVFAAMGEVEQNHAMGTLFSAMVSVDYKKIKQNSLFLSQPRLPMPREFYVLPQFTMKLKKRGLQIADVLKKFAEKILEEPDKYRDMIEKAAQDVVELERRIALASWADAEMRNYAQQYNPYDLPTLKKVYPSVKWESYLRSLLSTVGPVDFSGPHKRLIISQPSYFGWLNALFNGNVVDENTIVNYIITHLIFEDAEFLGGIFKESAEDLNYVRYAQRSGRGVARVGRQLMHQRDTRGDPNIPCMNFIMTYMPYGPGYVYVRSKQQRNDVQADIKKQTELVIESFLLRYCDLHLFEHFRR
ncbi:hypothetical protein RB195_025974 [Necator americanus]|uniref:Peptidase M13 N-terminal domain-containing protein n=1 Tax=Necator americanus TaxID=51031 RepID=A0ABR1EUP8_NECAM